MALDATTAQEMIKKLADDQAQYLNTLNRAHELLAQALTSAATGKPAPRLTSEGIRRNKTSSALPKLEVESVKKDSKGSVVSAEDDESSTDDNESLFASQHLPTRVHHRDDFKKHLHEHEWSAAGRAILHDVLENLHALHKKKDIFPTAAEELKHGPHLSHYSIFDGMLVSYPSGARFDISLQSDLMVHLFQFSRMTMDQPQERPKYGTGFTRSMRTHVKRERLSGGSQ